MNSEPTTIPTATMYKTTSAGQSTVSSRLYGRASLLVVVDLSSIATK